MYLPVIGVNTGPELTPDKVHAAGSVTTVDIKKQLP